MASVALALDSKCILGESPFCDGLGSIYFVDINGKKIHQFNSLMGTSSVISTPQMVGSVVPRASGGLVACMEVPIVTVDVERRQMGDQLGEMPESHRTSDFRFNDAKCDPAGRLWTGSMNAKWRDPSATPGRLYCLEPAVQSTPILVSKVVPTRLANGMAWSSDKLSMFFIDSFDRTVDVFKYDLGTGSISERRTVIQVSHDELGPPDGMAIDSNDKLWVVVGETGSVRQYDPETGMELTRVKLPVERPTSCAFGGKDLSELYVTTREEKGSSPSLHAGGLFKCQIPGIRGASFADSFAG